jgi:hypothetical protein
MLVEHGEAGRPCNNKRNHPQTWRRTSARLTGKSRFVATKLFSTCSTSGLMGQEDQRETWEMLKRALDEDRPSYRQLFP